MIDHKRKCIFIHIPKTAGTSIGKTFVPPACGDHMLQPFDYRAYWDDYFTFTAVRNPWDRLVSAYFFIVASCKRRSPVPMMSNPIDVFRDDFSGFIMEALPALVNHRGRGKNLIFAPQSWWLDAEYDKILRFETLDKDWRDLPDRIRPVDVLPELNGSAHKPFTEYYSKETSDVVGDLYREDVTALGYVAPVL